MYYIEISATTCTCTILCNGLYIEKLDAQKNGCLQYPCNTELIGTANRVEVQVTPASLDPSTFEKIDVQGMVKRYPDDGFIGPELGEVLASFSLYETVEMIKANPLANVADMIPFSLSAMFDSEDIPSMAHRLVEAEPLTDPDALRDWAMQFRLLLERGDIDGLYELYEPKLLDYDIAYPMQREPDNRVWFTNWMNEKIYPQRPFTGFGRGDVETVKWCDGRIWELRLKDGRPLWSTEGFEGKRTGIQVYVGMVDDKIRIVR